MLVIFIAFALRAWNLTGVPPGLTHDEANHGREAIGILEGVLRLFFPLNYGSEPIYSYTAALSMALFGRGLFALRLVNIFFGALTIAITTAWAAPRFGRAVALLGAALLAVSFWPLASSREALRAGMLPFFFTLAVWAFWRFTNDELGIRREEKTAYAKAQRSKRRKDESASLGALGPLAPLREPLRSSLLFGLAVAATLYIYLAARVSWLLFPLFLGYLALFHRAAFRRAWRPALAGLLLAGLLAAPLFLYLRAHPEMQTRLDMLDGPLQAIAAGQWRPVLANAADALLAFVWPGRGDQFLAYNIPGRPVFDVVSAVFFVVGLAVCLARWRRPAYAFLLLWFAAGILPSLVTGPTANTTRNLAALPAVFLIPAIGFVAAAGKIRNKEAHAKAQRSKGRKEESTSFGALGPFAPLREPLALPPATRYSLLAPLLAALWLAFAAFVSGRDYFVRWADMPEVRGAYQSTLVAALGHVADTYPDVETVVFSSVYPGAAHDPSIAYVLAADNPALSRTARWADARYALAIPPGASLAVVPASTPPHPALQPWLTPLATVEMRPDDLDPRFTIYALDGDRAAADLAAWAVPPVAFDGAVELVAAHWLADRARPGATAELLTAWRVLDPTRAGPAAPPTFASDAVLFTHVLDGAGGLLTQRDSLDAPSWAWQAGDLLVQIHVLAVPATAMPGDYAAVV
ncbi:MAG: glycosyltransferase family 39 protein, partial [Candidatus Promineofilum sp.]|nr:glycosyltransferase family 39 protein [Promineifilum sp.]